MKISLDSRKPITKRTGEAYMSVGKVLQNYAVKINREMGLLQDLDSLGKLKIHPACKWNHSAFFFGQNAQHLDRVRQEQMGEILQVLLPIMIFWISNSAPKSRKLDNFFSRASFFEENSCMYDQKFL